MATRNVRGRWWSMDGRYWWDGSRWLPSSATRPVQSARRRALAATLLAGLSLACTVPFWAAWSAQPVVVQADEAFISIPVMLGIGANAAAIFGLGAPLFSHTERWPRAGFAWASAVLLPFVALLYVPTIWVVREIGMLGVAAAAASTVLAFATAIALSRYRARSSE